MTKEEYNEKIKANEEIWRTGRGIGYYDDYVDAQMTLKDEYIESLEKALDEAYRLAFKRNRIIKNLMKRKNIKPVETYEELLDREG